MTLLDTHALVWWLDNPSKLSHIAKKTIEEEFEDKNLFVSSITIWEIAMLVKKNKLKLKFELKDWINRINLIPEIKSIPIDNEIAYKSVSVDIFHADPADRIIVATAMSLNCPIITKDAKIRKYKLVKSIW